MLRNICRKWRVTHVYNHVKERKKMYWGEKKVLQQAETDTVHKTHQQLKKKIKVFWDCKYSSLQESLLLKDPVPQSSSQRAGSARTQTPLMAKVRVQRGLKDAAVC